MLERTTSPYFFEKIARVAFGDRMELSESARELKRNFADQNIGIEKPACDILEILKPSKVRSQEIAVISALDSFIGEAPPLTVLTELPTRQPYDWVEPEAAAYFCLQQASLLKVGARCFAAMRPIPFGHDQYVFCIERCSTRLWLGAYNVNQSECCRSNDLWMFATRR